MKFFEMKQKVQQYFHNNPKRIALTWIAVHVVFLCVGLLVLVSPHQAIAEFNMLLITSVIMIYGFPAFPFEFLGAQSGLLSYNPSIIFAFLIPIIYYALFGAMCLVARDTRSRTFRIAHWVFTTWFLFNIITIFVLIFLTGARF